MPHCICICSSSGIIQINTDFLDKQSSGNENYLCVVTKRNGLFICHGTRNHTKLSLDLRIYYEFELVMQLVNSL